MYLNNKTYYTLLGSANKVEDIVNFAYKNKVPYIGICDVNTIQGAFSFIDLCIQKGVNPVIAVDTFALFNEKIIPVILIAKNSKAFIQINKIITNVYQKQYHDILQITDCYVVINSYDNEYIDIAKNNKDIFLSTNSHHILSIPHDDIDNFLLMDEVYFQTEKDFEFYKLLLAIKDNKQISKIKVDNHKGSYLKVIDTDIHDNLKIVKANMDKVVSHIKYDKIDSDYKIPVFDKNINADDYLKKLTYRGLKKRLNNNINDEYIKRLEYELDVITKLNFADYFLVVFDIIKFCKKNNIYVGPGRGSAAASLVSYTLGITNVDPIEYELIFERFLNVQRISMPDIDIDVEDTKREEVINYIFEKYGAIYACKIGTITTFQSKSSFREVAGAFGVDKKIIAHISKLLDSTKSFIANMENKKVAQEFALRSELKYIYDYVIKLQNYPKNRSIHAAGIIISPYNLYNYTAFENQSISITSAGELERQGLVKFDLLALSNLRFIHQLVDQIKRDYQIDINVNDINLDDKKVYEIFSKGMTFDVFQFESYGIREVLKKYQPQNFMDLATILALYRPGPMKHIDDYIKRKNKLVKYDFYFDELTDVLKSTYGVIVYQEQILQIVQILAGYDYAKADIFRRIISKKDEDKLKTTLQEFEQEVIARGYEESLTQKLVADIMQFASYGFNKAHAVSYAKISYAIAYLKVNYPLSFFQVVLNQKNTADKLKELLLEARYLKINIKRVDINKSDKTAKIDDGDILLGFENIKMISNSVIDEIIEKRTNSNNDETIEKMLIKYVANFDFSEKEIENMIFSGLFDTYGYNEKEMIDFVSMNNQAVDIDVFEFFTDTLALERKDNYNLVECERMEYQALDMNIKYRSLEKIYEMYKQRNDKLIMIEQVKNKKRYSFKTLFKVSKVKVIKTKNNETMCFIDVASYSENFSIVVFPKVYYQYEKQIKELKNNVMIAQINKNDDSFYLTTINKIY